MAVPVIGHVTHELFQIFMVSWFLAHTSISMLVGGIVIMRRLSIYLSTICLKCFSSHMHQWIFFKLGHNGHGPYMVFRNCGSMVQQGPNLVKSYKMLLL